MLALRVLPYTAGLFNAIPSGPIAILFAIIHQYIRLVPEAYHFKIFGLGMSDKIWVYALAVQVSRLLPAGFPYSDRFLGSNIAFSIRRTCRGSRTIFGIVVPLRSIAAKGVAYTTSVSSGYLHRLNSQ